jgi:hypothetical protein
MNWVAWTAAGLGAWLGGSLLFVVFWGLAKRPRRSYYSPVAEAEAILAAHCECCSGS